MNQRTRMQAATRAMGLDVLRVLHLTVGLLLAGSLLALLLGMGAGAG